MPRRPSQILGPQPYDPEEDGPQRFFNAPGVVVGLAAALALIHLSMTFLSPRTRFLVEAYVGLAPARFGAEGGGGGAELVGALFSHALLHGDWVHYGFNALWLVAFGAPVATRLGARAGGAAGFYGSLLFISLFMSAAAAGGAMFLALHWGEATILVGASGGVSGLLGALTRFGFRRPSPFDDPRRLTGMNDRTVVALTIVFVLTNVAVALAPSLLAGGRAVAWEAHVGGYLFGMTAFPLFHRARPRVRDG